MDSLKFLLYTLARIGLMLASLVLALIFGKLFFPILSSFVPDSMSGINSFFTSSDNGSIVAWITMLAVLGIIFLDDGKRHAAYESWSSVNVTITLILMLLIYFVPAIFRDSFHSEGKGKIFYEFFYFPCRWLNQRAGVEYTLSVALGIGVILLFCFLMYLLSFKLYVKKHPVILRRLEPAEPEAETTEE
ncbi:hypothetical protein [Ruminococcus sp. Marseille-P6503]|uniref:hypothetical protein n=1 Tax=Ruminococcus sp. Marseille-P6503 TaxID=2364796 RepID=UPI000F52F11E|nr:hypothetical protein [Ruminococcus sp. Marseille-P6503]